ncbi:hypothetical protein E2C01_069785 [Portunus trituberculatus]|uniref:Uncharacterized protein n=1 Tax=Portunus trituberculatus TaxID=210409 RepID=A0A5B7I397_PORTR|nr:hypothetical protein [Portunus trituberculatus]
MVPLYHGC